MHRAASSLLISLASLALTAASVAQTAATPPATSTPIGSLPAVITMTTPHCSCPVGLRARPGVGGNIMTIDASDGVGSQMLSLDLSNIGSRHITGAQITVHGLTAHGHVIPASSYLDAGTTTKRIDLALTVAPGATTSTNLLFKGFTSVSTIDLDSLTYADGSTWHASPQHTCQITPDRFMLVAGH
jgi:hypothetical protein